jgi:hypothetical protein
LLNMKRILILTLSLILLLSALSCTPMNNIAKSDKARHAVRKPGKSR